MAESPVVLLSGHAPHRAARARRLPGDGSGRGGRAGVQGRVDGEGRRAPGRGHRARAGSGAERATGARAREPARRPARGEGRRGATARGRRGASRRRRPRPPRSEQALALLAAARRPLILLGGAMARGPRRAAVARAQRRRPASPRCPWRARAASTTRGCTWPRPLLAEADLRAPARQAARLRGPLRASRPAFAAGLPRRSRWMPTPASARARGARAARASSPIRRCVADQLAAAARGRRRGGHRAWGDEVHAARARRCPPRGLEAPARSPRDADPPAPGLRGAPAPSRSRRHPGGRRRRVRPVGAGRARGGDAAHQRPRGLHRQRDPDGDRGQAPRIPTARSSRRWATAPSASTPSSSTPRRATGCRW